MQQLEDIDCIVCGCEIRANQQNGESACGHGLMHYNCSYLQARCTICSQLLTISAEHQSLAEHYIQDQYTVFIPQSSSPSPDNEADSKTTEAKNRAYLSAEFAEIKRMMLAMRTQIMMKLNEMSTEMENIKQKMLEQQKEIYKIKLELVQKEMKDIKVNGSTKTSD